MANPVWNPTADQPYSFMLPKSDTNALPFTTVPGGVPAPAAPPAQNNKWMGIVLLGAAAFGIAYFTGILGNKKSKPHDEDDGFEGAFAPTPKKRKSRKKTKKVIRRTTRKTTKKITRRTARRSKRRVTGHI